MGEVVHFTCPNGSAARGYLARAAPPGGAPGVVVVQEWWGVNRQIKGVADRFATAGYNAFVPDLFDGRVAADAEEAEHLSNGLDWVGACEQEVRGAAEYLRAMGGKVGVVGFCMGGALAIIAAVKVTEVDAAVCYYGIPPAEAADARRIRAPLQAHFANDDDWCTPEAVGALEGELRAGGAEFELYRYDAKHAFFNEERPEVYDAAAAEVSWNRSLEFLRSHLR